MKVVQVGLSFAADQLITLMIKLPTKILTLIALLLVRFYRRFISPYKGFRCAHGALHGISCSDVALQALTTKPFFSALADIQSQRSACRLAHESIKLQGGLGSDLIICDC